MGIGFAIPAKLAQSVMVDIIDHGQVVRGWLGVEMKQANQNFNDDGSFNTKTSEGVAIAGVVRGGPAAEGGIKPNDVILSVNGQKTITDTELVKMIAGIKPETAINIVVKRDKQEVELSVKVGKRPKVEQLEAEEE